MESEAFEDFTIDLEAQAVHFQGGFSASIHRMLDEDGEDTFELEEVVVVLFKMPPDGSIVGVNVTDDEDVKPEFEH